MKRLSTREREKVLQYDLHGIREEMEETPELLGTEWAQMEEEISLLNSKDAYESAAKQNLSYVRPREKECSICMLSYSLFDSEVWLKIVSNSTTMLEEMKRRGSRK